MMLICKQPYSLSSVYTPFYIHKPCLTSHYCSLDRESGHTKGYACVYCNNLGCYDTLVAVYVCVNSRSNTMLYHAVGLIVCVNAVVLHACVYSQVVVYTYIT